MEELIPEQEDYLLEQGMEDYFKKRFKNKATFRFAPGSDNPYSTSVARVIITTKDEKTYKILEKMENKILDAFDKAEIVIFK